MGILARMIERSWPAADDDFWYLPVGVQTASGVKVSELGALKYSAVFACVKVLAETVGSLPLLLYRRLEGRGKARASDHPLFAILHDAPNPDMSKVDFWEAMVAYMALWGNAYAVIEASATGPRGLWPLRPDRVTLTRDPDTGGRLYRYAPSIGDVRMFSSEEILHVRLFSLDGVNGLSPIAYHRETIGLALAAQEFGARVFSNDATPGGVLRHPGVLKPEARKNLKESWEKAHSGLSKAHKVAILEEGMEWVKVGMPAKDIQYLETRKFSRSEIASIYRVPPHMIGDLERATFSNVEQQALDFVVHTLTPWLTRIEKAIGLRLLKQEERRVIFAEHLVDGLLRGDVQSRYGAYATGRQWGWMSANDVRERENMNPIDGGDVYLTPLNMVPAGQGMPDMGEEESLRVGRNGNGRGFTHDESRSISGRRRIERAHNRQILDAAGRLVHSEVRRVRSGLRGGTGHQDADGMRRWIDDFYDGFPETVVKVMLPSLSSLAGSVWDEAIREIDAEPIDGSRFDAFIGAYSENMGLRHSISSRRQLAALVGEAGGEAAWDAIDARLGEWEERRPAKMALREMVQLGSATAWLAWIISGVKMLRWVSVDPCRICEELDGRVVGIDQNFGNSGDQIGPLTVRRAFRTPPAHPGCGCTVAPKV